MPGSFASYNINKKTAPSINTKQCKATFNQLFNPDISMQCAF